MKQALNTIRDEFFDRWRQISGTAVVVAVSGIAVVVVVVLIMNRPRFLDGQRVVDAVYAYEDGGGTTLVGSGSPRKITHKGRVILREATRGTHCVGFTFSVMWDVAEAEGWFEQTYLDDVSALQRDWFNATNESALKGCVYAMEKHGLGREVPLAEAKSGDFVQIQRSKSRTAHQSIFLEWIENDNGVIGIRYRGSQGTTDGIADNEEYFAASGLPGAELDPDRIYVGRLFRQPDF